MNSEADYQKMTIAHLKEELTKRGITPDAKAKKNDLIKLLQKAEEDAILNHSEDGAYGDPLSTPDEDLLNDDVLNDVLPEKLIDDVTEPAKTNEDRKPIVEEEKLETTVATLHDSHDPLALDAKLKRAQRFGLPVGVTDPIAKAKRAERFGLATVGADKDMKAKRAERFGLSKESSTEPKTLSAVDEETRKKLLNRAQRFGLPVNENGKALSSIQSKDALASRAQRFGLKTSAAVDEELEQKKKARLERFGAK